VRCPHYKIRKFYKGIWWQCQHIFYIYPKYFLISTFQNFIYNWRSKPQIPPSSKSCLPSTSKDLTFFCILVLLPHLPA
jgi:hypothetical protein